MEWNEGFEFWSRRLPGNAQYLLKLTTIYCPKERHLHLPTQQFGNCLSCYTHRCSVLPSPKKKSELHITQCIFSPRPFLLKRSKAAAGLERKPGLPLDLHDGEGNTASHQLAQQQTLLSPILIGISRWLIWEQLGCLKAISCAQSRGISNPNQSSN